MKTPPGLRHIWTLLGLGHWRPAKARRPLATPHAAHRRSRPKITPAVLTAYHRARNAALEAEKRALIERRRLERARRAAA